MNGFVDCTIISYLYSKKKKSHEISRYICYQLIIFPKRLWSMCKNGMVSTTYILFESFVDDYIGTQIFLSNHDVKFYDSFISQVFFFFLET